VNALGAHIVGDLLLVQVELLDLAVVGIESGRLDACVGGKKYVDARRVWLALVTSITALSNATIKGMRKSYPCGILRHLHAHLHIPVASLALTTGMTNTIACCR